MVGHDGLSEFKIQDVLIGLRALVGVTFQADGKEKVQQRRQVES